MSLTKRRGGRWSRTALKDKHGWRRIVWSDFTGALALILLLGGLLGVASSCT